MSAPSAVAPTGTEMMQHLVESAGAAQQPAADMADLAEVIRTLLAVEARRDTRVRLGGNLFDVVITSSGPEAYAAVALMDAIQGGCGPVIEDPESGWLYWLVPPGSADRWAPHAHAVCLSAPHTITLPSLNRTMPPGPYWHRPSASDRLVPTGPLREALAQLRPEPTPHADLEARLGITF
ncbi:hypothetical protein QJ054_34030 [Streptomyces sp. AN-3]|uniref:hypothetical protein n=1 Tax=Streptomyces sp. AN-3 TaxID=3044177 RepID=UPI00249CB4AA|nr:hypothetical protein [Streptomyces sp. AN-3]MDI3102057.1 hypothetical protein [Streptomyces sp. AN-3]MDV6291303.1 hypothetical protein [Streptomyces sp. UP1A-1]